MSKTLKPIQFFKPGTFTSQAGRSIEFTEAMLLDAQASYDPAVYQAPLVAGHPKTEDPNYGLVAGLNYAEGHLYAVPENVEESFAELVAAKRFNTVSASWYMPDNPANPKPGHLNLKHLGFLGAVPPSLKGLKSPEAFSEEEDGCVTTFAELDGWTTGTLADLLRGLREWVIGKFGQDEADQALPSWSVNQISNQAAQPTPPEEVPVAFPSYSEAPQEVPILKPGDPGGVAPTPAEVALTAQKAELDALAVTLKAKSDALAVKELDLKKSEVTAYAEQLVKDGKVLPKEKDSLVAFAMGLSGEQIVEFSEEGGTEPVRKAGLDFLKDFFSKRPAVVTFSEVATPGGDKPLSSLTSFVAPPGSQVDPAAAELHQKAVTYAEQHACSFSEAYEAIGGN